MAKALILSLILIVVAMLSFMAGGYYFTEYHEKESAIRRAVEEYKKKGGGTEPFTAEATKSDGLWTVFITRTPPRPDDFMVIGVSNSWLVVKLPGEIDFPVQPSHTN